MSQGDSPPIPHRSQTEARFARADHTAWRRIGDETVILDQAGHRLFGLNETAGVVWHLLDSSRSAEELCSVSGVSPDELASFLGQLERSGLVQPAAATSERKKPEAKGERTPPQRGSVDTPAITWQEPLQHAAQTMACAFLPAQNPLCNSAPFS